MGNPAASKKHNASNFRGDAYATVKITINDVKVNGLTTNHGVHGAQLQLKDNKVPNHLVGLELNDGVWVKSILADGNAYVAGWQGWTCTASPRDLKEILAENPHIPLPAA